MNIIKVVFYISIFILFNHSIYALEGIGDTPFDPREASIEDWNSATPDDISTFSDTDIIDAINNERLSLDKADEYFSEKGAGSKPEAFNTFSKKKYDIEVTPQSGDTYKDGVLTTKDKSTVDLNSLEKGVKIESTSEGVKIIDKNGNLIDVNNAKNIRQENEALKIDSSDTFRVDETFATNAKGISYDGNTLSIEKADSIIINSKDILTEVSGFNINPKKFKIAQADTVRIGTDDGYIYIEDVTDSTFRSNGVVEITADGDVDYDIEDLAGNIVNFNSKENGRVTFTKDDSLPTYFIESSTIKILDETLSTNTTATVSIDPSFGFVFLILGPGSYFQNDKYGFLVIEPMDGVNYSLGLRKFKDLYFGNLLSDACVHCGLIDFMSEDNYLKGRIIFKIRVSNDYWLNLFDNIMSKISFTGLSFMEYVSIDETNNDLHAFVSPTNYYILKEHGGFGYLNKYALLLDNRTNSIIGTYSVIPDDMTIQIENNILSINNRIRVYPKNSIPLEVFLYG